MPGSIAAFVDPAFRESANLSTVGAWMAVLGYTFQLYFDFSGYSSMAIGLGFLFGLRIPINFNSPYKALDPSDFWRRWHISLSSCLRDYVYIPLGGSRYGVCQTYVNLMLTMLLGGIWHGANWTFVVWGAYHGLLLCAFRAWGKPLEVLPPLVRQLLMFFFVVIGWVFFRSESLDQAIAMLSRMFVPTAGNVVAQPMIFMIFLALAATWAMWGRNPVELNENFKWSPRHSYIYAAIFGASLAVIAGGRASPFLYFQF